MSNEIQIALQESGLSVYAGVRNTAGQFWSVYDSQWFPINDHNLYWTNAQITLYEQGTSGDYYGNMPAVAANDTYFIEIYEKFKPTAAANRKDDWLITTTPMYWTGSALLVNPAKCV
jgi:hypothetical protein